MSRDRDDRDDRRGRDRDDRGNRDRDDRGRDRDRGSDRGRDREDRGRDRDDRGSSRGSSGSSRSFSYQERSADDMKERASKGARDYDKLLKPGIKMFGANDGGNRLRLIPPTWEGAKHYGKDVYVHYGIGPDRDSYICPKQMNDEPCPICEERDRARREDRPDEDYVKDLEPKRRVLVYLIDRDDEREGVQAWMMPWTLDKDIIKVSTDKSSGEVLLIDHPEKGYDIDFDKTGKGARTKYEGVQVARRDSPLGKDEWLDFAMDNPLPDQLQIYSYDHIAKAFGAAGVQRDSRGGDRDRDDRDRDGGRDRDRDSRDRDNDRGRGDDRGRDRDRDSRDSRSSGRDKPKGPTWESVHDMTRTELEDLVDLEKLDVQPKDAKDDEDLADWICEEMKLEKGAEPARAERREVSRDRDTDPDDRSGGRSTHGADDRMDRMRERRERR